MGHILNAVEDLDQLADNSTQVFQDIVLDMAVSVFQERDTIRQEEQMRRLIKDTMVLADLMGRRRFLLEIGDAEPEEFRATNEPAFLFAETPVVPGKPFKEALEDLLSRKPVLRKTVKGVNSAYQRHSFALARSTNLTVTRRVRQSLAKSIREGRRPEKAIDVIKNIGGFSRAYAQTVYRTNLNTAFTAGRFRQAQDPEFRNVIGAWEFRTQRDDRVRDNHRAADTFIAGLFDPIWNTLAPPLGFNCRCELLPVKRSRLRRLGLITNGRVGRRTPRRFSEASSDVVTGNILFRTIRPDALIYTA